MTGEPTTGDLTPGETSGEPTTGAADTTPARATRRGVFAAAGAIGAGAVLAACGAGAGGSPAGSDGSATGPDGGGDGSAGAGVLAEADEIEVGAGVVNADENVVVTRPSEGDFRGFSATCTHEGCQLVSVSEGTINCPCHGSRYSIADGSVVRAAPGLTVDTQQPLARVPVTVDAGSVVRA